MKNLIFLMGIGVIILSSCYYDNTLELYGPVTDCEDPNVSYVATVLPIIEAKCYACHDSANANSLGSGIDIEGHANLKVFADNGSLIASMRGQGVTLMPLGGTVVTDCNISKISIWISEGSKDN